MAKTNWVILLREVMAVYSDNHAINIKIHCVGKMQNF
jgi:hypothetical protein